MIRPFLLTCSLLASTSAWSVDLNRGLDRNTDETYNYIYLTAGGGGDTLADPNSGRSLRAGGLFYAAYGFRFTNDEAESVVIDIRAGTKYDTIEDGDVSFFRIPIEFEIQTRINELFGLSVGITYHLKPKYRMKIGSVDDKIDFDDALGWYVGLEYRLTQDISMGTRFTTIEYEKEGTSFLLPGASKEVDSIDGGGAEFFLLFRFY